MPPRKWPLSQSVKRGEGQGSQASRLEALGLHTPQTRRSATASTSRSCRLESQVKVSAGWFLLRYLPASPCSSLCVCVPISSSEMRTPVGLD